MRLFCVLMRKLRYSGNRTGAVASLSYLLSLYPFIMFPGIFLSFQRDESDLIQIKLPKKVFGL